MDLSIHVPTKKEKKSNDKKQKCSPTYNLISLFNHTNSSRRIWRDLTSMDYWFSHPHTVLLSYFISPLFFLFLPSSILLSLPSRILSFFLLFFIRDIHPPFSDFFSAVQFSLVALYQDFHFSFLFSFNVIFSLILTRGSRVLVIIAIFLFTFSFFCMYGKNSDYMYDEGVQVVWDPHVCALFYSPF